MTLSSLVILIVDDSPEDRELYRRYLNRDRSYNYTLLEASLGQEGLELWHRHKPDAVILDYRLPDLDGLEFLAQLPSSTSQPCLPVVVLTGQGNESIAVQAIKAGAQNYLVKEQITPEGLHWAVMGAIKTVQLHTQLQQQIDRQGLLAQITQLVHQSLHLDDILQTTVTEVRQFLHTDRVLVFRLDPEGKGMVLAESVGSEWRSLLASTIYDPCLAENALPTHLPQPITYDPAFTENYVKRYRQGQVTAIADLQAGNIEPCHVELLASFQVQAYLVIPILHDDQFWGFLIAHHCVSPRVWKPLEIDLLQDLATHVSIALRQAELYQQAQDELSERRQVEAELRESEERFRQLAENIDAVFWVREEPEGRVCYVSPAYERLWGWEPQQLYENQQTWVDHIHPDDREWSYIAFQSKAAAGRFDEEYRLVLTDGTIRWVRDRAFPLHNGAGEIYRFAGITEDITDRKLTELALQASRVQLQQQLTEIEAIYQHAPIGLNVLDTELRFVRINQRLAEINGCAVEAHLGRTVRELLPDLADTAEQLLLHILKTGEPLLNIEIHGETPAQPGVQRVWLEHFCPLKQGDRVIGISTVCEEITDRKQAQEALQQGEERLRTSIDNMLDCFGIYRAIRNEQGQIVNFRTEYLNEAACLNTCMTCEQELGQGLCELLPDSITCALFAEYCQVVETGQPLLKEHLLYTDIYGQQHLTRAFDIRVAKLEDGFVATWRDITEQKQLENQLRNNEQQLRLALLGANAGTWDWDLTLGKLHWSVETYQLYGLNPANGLPAYEDWVNHLLHPDDHSQVEETLTQVIEQHLSELQIEFRIIHPQKGVRWLLSIGRLIVHDQGARLSLSGINLDITDRKIAEIALAESEAQLKLMYGATRSGLWDWDLISNIVQVSAEYCDLYGLDPAPQEISFEQWLSCLHPDDQNSVFAVVNQTLQQRQEYYEDEFRILHPQGVRWMAARGQVFFNATGDVVRMIGNVQDITDRKHIERQLQDRERQFTTLAEASPSAIFQFNTATNCIYVNRRWSQLTGYSAEAGLGMGWIDTIHPDERDRLATAWLEWCADAKAPGRFEVEGRILHPDGSVVDYICQAVPELNSDGSVVGYIGTLIDVTERKRIEKALVASEAIARAQAEELAALMDITPAALWIAYDPQCHYMTANRAAYQLMRTEAGAVATATPADGSYPLSFKQYNKQGQEFLPLDLPLQKAIRTGQEIADEIEFVFEDGTSEFLYGKAVPLYDPAGNVRGGIAAFTSISALKQIEREREQILQREQAARAQAERANRIKDDFLTVLSHELRSPLNPILGWAQLMQSRRFDQTKTAEALAIIERNARLQAQLINDLLDIAKILRGKLIMDPGPVDLVFVINSALDTVKTAAVAKAIQLHSTLSEVGWVHGDPTRLQQIVWNLLNNAIKFTPNRGRVDICLQRVDDQAQITVRDTGKGINPSFLPYLFNTFVQEDASTTRQYGGLGLGLAIVRSLVEAHGGTISADSLGEGQGATFIVQLPMLDTASGIKRSNKLPQLLDPDVDLKGVRVLCIDDEADARDLLMTLLSDYGADVLTVSSVPEVLVSLQSWQPDVLISDVGMPQIDGYMLIQQVRALPPEKGGQIPAIALTAYAREQDQQRALTGGYQRHIAKPLDLEQLVQAIVSLVR